MSEIQLTPNIVADIQKALSTHEKLGKGILVLVNALKNGPVRLDLANLKRVTENIRDGNTRPAGDRIAVSMGSAKEARRRQWEILNKEFGNE